MGPNPAWLVSSQKGETWTERQTYAEGRQCEETQGEGHVKTESGIETMLPSTMESLGLPEARRGQEGCPPTGLRGTTGLQTT